MAKVKTSKGSVRAKLGLPAKAGRRKIYAASSKRKQKDWAHLGKGYAMTHTVPEEKNNAESKKYGEHRLTESEVQRRQAVLSVQYTEH